MGIDMAAGGVAAAVAPTGSLLAQSVVALPLPGTRPVANQAAADVLQHAAQRVVDAMAGGGVTFSFTIDKQSGMTIVKVFNKATGELVRQIPGEVVVHVAQLLREDEQHQVLDLKA